MQQINKYTVQSLGTDEINILTAEDAGLVKNYTLNNVVFLPNKYTINLNVYDLEGNFVETAYDLKSYTIPGSVQAGEAIEVTVDPVKDGEDLGYLGDIIVQYNVYNNVFSSTKSTDTDSYLYITGLSTDRTELRAKSVNISDADLKRYVNLVYEKLNEQAYFSTVYLDFYNNNVEAVCTNVITEIVDGIQYVTFKLYKPLDDSIDLKSKFYVQERIGEPTRFQIIRNVEIVPDEQPKLKGPNFNIDVEDVFGDTTEYLNYNQLFSYPASSSYTQLYSTYNQTGISLGLDHSDYSNFIHFSSAAERLENFRYKLGLIFNYRDRISKLEKVGTSGTAEIGRYEKLIDGVVANFDHYDQYLYFESSSTAWPKSNDVKPYKNINPEDSQITDWWENQLDVATEYDSSNPDLLVKSIPQFIREDVRNAAYVAFVHMIGQHFDDEWVYAKAITTHYDTDNRLDFGISKDLVWEAIRSLGIKIYQSNQNLNSLFERNSLTNAFYYNTGSETTVNKIYRITNEFDGQPVPIVFPTNNYDEEFASSSFTGVLLDGEYAVWVVSGSIADGGGANFNTAVGRGKFQPVLADDYHKEVYKRIYHNLPLLLKTKGTERGLRALINCFGIPDDVLQIEVQGGTKIEDTSSFFGSRLGTTSSLDRIRLDNTGSRVPLEFSGSVFYTSSAQSKYTSVETQNKNYVDTSHEITVGFNLNKQFTDYVRQNMSSSFDYDDLIGDPRNTEENYGVVFSNTFNQFIADHSGSLCENSGSLKITRFRTTQGILRLVRYIDTALFRTLQQFLPVRVSTTVGAVVEDHILHRNRYAGQKTAGQLKENLEGTVETVNVTGSAGGVFNRFKQTKSGVTLTKTFQTYEHSIVTNLPTTNYNKFWTVGAYTGSKAVVDDSSTFNGELSGSVSKITDGELNSENPYKKGGKNVDGFSEKFRDYDAVLNNVSESINSTFATRVDLGKWTSTPANIPDFFFTSEANGSGRWYGSKNASDTEREISKQDFTEKNLDIATRRVNGTLVYREAPQSLYGTGSIVMVSGGLFGTVTGSLTGDLEGFISGTVAGRVDKITVNTKPRYYSGSVTGSISGSGYAVGNANIDGYVRGAGRDEVSGLFTGSLDAKHITGSISFLSAGINDTKKITLENFVGVITGSNFTQMPVEITGRSVVSVNGIRAGNTTGVSYEVTSSNTAFSSKIQNVTLLGEIQSISESVVVVPVESTLVKVDGYKAATLPLDISSFSGELDLSVEYGGLSVGSIFENRSISSSGMIITASSSGYYSQSVVQYNLVPGQIVRLTLTGYTASNSELAWGLYNNSSTIPDGYNTGAILLQSGSISEGINQVTLTVPCSMRSASLLVNRRYVTWEKDARSYYQTIMDTTVWSSFAKVRNLSHASEMQGDFTVWKLTGDSNKSTTATGFIGKTSLQSTVGDIASSASVDFTGCTEFQFKTFNEEAANVDITSKILYNSLSGSTGSYHNNSFSGSLSGDVRLEFSSDRLISRKSIFGWNNRLWKYKDIFDSTLNVETADTSSFNYSNVVSILPGSSSTVNITNMTTDFLVPSSVVAVVTTDYAVPTGSLNMLMTESYSASDNVDTLVNLEAGENYPMYVNCRFKGIWSSSMGTSGDSGANYTTLSGSYTKLSGSAREGSLTAYNLSEVLQIDTALKSSDLLAKDRSLQSPSLLRTNYALKTTWDPRRLIGTVKNFRNLSGNMIGEISSSIGKPYDTGSGIDLYLGSDEGSISGKFSGSLNGSMNVYTNRTANSYTGTGDYISGSFAYGVVNGAFSVFKEQEGSGYTRLSGTVARQSTIPIIGSYEGSVKSMVIPEQSKFNCLIQPLDNMSGSIQIECTNRFKVNGTGSADDFIIYLGSDDDTYRRTATLVGSILRSYATSGSKYYDNWIATSGSLSGSIYFSSSLNGGTSSLAVDPTTIANGGNNTGIYTLVPGNIYIGGIGDKVTLSSNNFNGTVQKFRGIYTDQDYSGSLQLLTRNKSFTKQINFIRVSSMTGSINLTRIASIGEYDPFAPNGEETLTWYTPIGVATIGSGSTNPLIIA